MSTENPIQIQLFFHCKRCVDRLGSDAIAVGLDASHVVVVWCESCNGLVARLTKSTIERIRTRGCSKCGAETAST